MTARRVWFDFENSPHVPFLLPFVEEFEKRGWEVVSTARDRSQTKALLDLYGIPHRMDADPHPTSTIGKATAVLGRSARLAARFARRRPALAIGHGSRSQVLAAALLRVPAVTFLDYEHVSLSVFRRLAARLFIPRAILGTVGSSGRIVAYDGVKEEIYLHQQPPAAREVDPFADLAIPEDAIRVVVRGPATKAHYLGAAGDRLYAATLERLLAVPDVHLVVFERYADRRSPAEAARVHRPGRVYDVRALLAGADLVVGGGGTMVREAAVAGVPAVSVFAGKPGAVDALLSERGRLLQIRDESELDRIPIRRRQVRGLTAPPRTLFDDVFERILALAGP